MRPTSRPILAVLMICLTLAALLPADRASFAGAASRPSAIPLSPCSITEPPPPPPPGLGASLVQPAAGRSLPPASPVAWATPALFKDINPNFSDTPSQPTRFMTVGNLTYFIAVENNTAAEIWAETSASVGLWRSDGTAAGTFKLKTIDYNGNFLTPYDYPLEQDGWVYFFVHSGQYKRQLWRTDGTLAGTTLFAGDFLLTCAGIPGELTSFQDGFLFAAEQAGGAAGHELWRSDGTAAGTKVFKDLAPGPDSSYVKNLVKVGDDQLYFTTFITDVVQLWHSDGTVTGTLPIKSLSRQGSNNYQDFHAVSLGDRLLMALYTPEHGAELWVSDGTPAGTVLVKDINPGTGSSWIDGFAAVGDTVYFSATTPTHGNELWVTQGTSATTTLVTDLIPGYVSSNPYNLTAFNDRVLFNAGTYEHGSELWASDGTAAGTTLVKDTLAGAESGKPANLTVLGADLFFTAAMSTTQLMLWKTGGTTASTQPVAPICAGSVCQNLGLDGRGMARLGDRLVLGGANDAHNHEPWLVDLNSQAAGLLKNISVTGLSSHPGYLTEVDGGLFFNTSSTVFPAPTPPTYELWHSDGTAAGTTMLKSFRGMFALHEHNGLLLLNGYEPVSGYELWRSDGTVTGTFQLKDIHPGAGNSNPEMVAQVGDIFYFTADDGATGRELWRTDGTISGTFQLKDIRPGAGASTPFVIKQLGGLLLFDIDDGVSGREPWRTDGTISGTFQLKDIRPGADGSMPVSRSSTVFAGKVFFSADDGASGQELWMSDGTITGTSQLGDLRPGGAHSAPEFITVFSDTLLFTASNGGLERALWSTDGTAGGTVQLKQISPPAQTIYIHSSVVITDHVIFSAFNSEGAYQLWRSDGTAAGTVLLYGGTDGDFWSAPRYLTVLGDVLFFATSSEANTTTHLWRSDGTPGGTIKIADLPYNLRIGRLTVHQGRVFLIATPNSGGPAPQLWASDGTSAGTAAINPASDEGGALIEMTNLISSGSSLFMTIIDNQGRELWIYDDSPAGLRIWKDIAPEAASSTPEGLTLVGDQLFFTANDSVHGRELWHSAPQVVPPTYAVYLPLLRR